MILQEFYFRIFPSFELKLEILNIMPVYKFEINWVNKYKSERAYNISGRTDGRTDGRTNGRPAFLYPPLRLGGGGQLMLCLINTTPFDVHLNSFLNYMLL